MAGGWDGVKLVLLFTSHSTIFKWFGAFILALESSSGFIFGSVESDTGVDPGFLDSYRFNFTKWEGGGFNLVIVLVIFSWFFFKFSMEFE